MRERALDLLVVTERFGWRVEPVGASVMPAVESAAVVDGSYGESSNSVQDRQGVIAGHVLAIHTPEPLGPARS